jgi:plastocyanin
VSNHGARGGVLIAAVLASCRPSAQAAAPVATDRVALPPSYMFRPAAITVPAGTKVTWTNTDHFTHSVRLLDLGVQPMILKPGDSTNFTFTTPGTHPYDCSFHPHDMHGEVVVTPAH